MAKRTGKDGVNKYRQGQKGLLRSSVHRILRGIGFSPVISVMHRVAISEGARDYGNRLSSGHEAGAFILHTIMCRIITGPD
jgi:hypothetical protein